MLITISDKNKEIVKNIVVMIYLFTKIHKNNHFHIILILYILYSLHITQYKLNILMISLIIVVCNVILQFTNSLLVTMYYAEVAGSTNKRTCK